MRHVKDLHAKVVIGGDKALVGSANFTSKGLTGRDEMAVLFEGTEHVAALSRWFDDLWAVAGDPDEAALLRFVDSIPAGDDSTDAPTASLPSPARRVYARVRPVQTDDGEHLDARSRFVQKLQQAPSRGWADHYLDLVCELVEVTGLESDDPRLVMSLPVGPELPVTICQRYVLAAFRQRRPVLSMMLPNEPALLQGLRVVRWGGGFRPRKREADVRRPFSVSIEVNDPAIISEMVRNEWRKLARLELGRGRYSSFKKHHEPSADGRAGTCMVRGSEQAHIPDEIKLALGNGQVVDTDRVWDFLWRRNSTPICRTTDLHDAPDTCSWNGAVRDKFPMSFRIVSEDPKTPLSAHIQLIRVYLNGDLTFAWSATPTETEVRIPFSTYARARNLPYGANLDLQVVPTGVSLSRVADEPVKVAETYGWLARAATEAIETIKTTAPGAADVITNLKCLQYQGDSIGKLLQALGTGEGAANIDAPPNGCGDIDFVDGYADLAAYFDSLDHGVALTKARTDKAIAFLQRLSEWADGSAQQRLGKVTGADAAVVAPIASQLKQISSALTTVQGLVQHSGESVERTILAYRAIRETAKRVQKDSTVQAQMFADYAARLEAAGGPFAERKPNPAPIAGATTLMMNYRDIFQTYALAPWHAVPVRFVGTNKGAELSVGNAIPIIDLFGLRWQWDQNRFADFRIGGGAFYVPDKFTNDDGKEVEVYNPGAELNFALANLHVGYGFVLGSDVTESSAKGRSRLMIGLDLYKLITGTNLEVQ